MGLRQALAGSVKARGVSEVLEVRGMDRYCLSEMAKKSDEWATMVFRIMIGFLGVIGLLLVISFADQDSYFQLFSYISLTVFFIGYGFGGDRWGAKMWNLFHFWKIPEDEEDEE